MGRWNLTSQPRVWQVRCFSSYKLRGPKRLEDHNLRLITNEFFNGLPTQPFDKRSARGIKAAIGYDSGSTILKFLQPVNFCRTGTTPNRAAVSKVGLNDMV